MAGVQEAKLKWFDIQLERNIMAGRKNNTPQKEVAVPFKESDE